MGEVKTCKSTGDYVNDAIDMVYETEVEPLKARIAELEQMVRELVEAVDQCFGNVAISMDDEIVWANTRRKALAMLQPEAGKEVVE